MPPQPAVSHVEIFNVLKDLQIFNENKQLKKELDSVWGDAAKKLFPMKRHNLYSFVKDDRKKIKTQLWHHNFSVQNDPVSNLDHTLQKSVEDKANEINCNSFLHEQENKDQSSTDIYDNLHKMKTNVNYYAIVQKISVKPFHLLYWSPEQIDIYKDIVYNEMPVCVMVIDKMQTITLKDYKSKNIFLVAFACEIENFKIVLAQALTENLTRQFAMYFSLEFTKKKKTVPKHLIIGYSKDLLNGISFSFNRCSFANYNVKCFDHLKNGSGELPSVLLHIDLMTVLKIVDGLKCFKDKVKLVKIFYLKCLIYLRTVSEFDEFEKIVIYILTLILNPFENKWVASCKLNLSEQINNSEVIKVYDDFKICSMNQNLQQCFNFLNEEDMHTLDGTSQRLLDYVNALKSQAVDTHIIDSESATKVNAYYCPQWYDDYFKVLLTEFPAWTGVIQGCSISYSLSTSLASQHSQLNEMNSSANIAEFLSSHINVINLSVREAQIYSKNVDKSEFNQNVYNSCLHYEENWKGKNNCYPEEEEEKEEEEKGGVEKEECNIGITSQLKEANQGNHNVCTDKYTENVKLKKISSENHNKSIIVSFSKTPNEEAQNTSTSYDKVLHPKNHTKLEAKQLENTCPNFDKINDEYIDLNIEHNFDHTHEFSNNLSNIDDLDKKSFTELEVQQITNPYFEKINDACTDVNIADDDFILTHEDLLDSFSYFNAKSGNTSLPNDLHEKNCTELETKQVISTGLNFETMNRVCTDANTVQNFVPTQECLDSTLFHSTPKREIAVNIELGQSDSPLTQNVLHEHNYFSPVQKLGTNKRKRKTVKSHVNLKKRKYVTACPSMKVQHDQTTCKKKRKESLIRNEKGMEPKSINKKKYNIHNTSALDSIAEVFTFAYKNMNNFQIDCENSSCSHLFNKYCFMNIMIKYGKSGKVASFYKDRSYLLFEYATIEDDYDIFIRDNVGCFFSNIMKDHYSFRIDIICLPCDEVTYNFETRIVLDISSVKDLQTLLKNYLEKKKNICSKCKDVGLTSYGFGPYMCIDLEETYCLEYLDDIPEYLNFTNEDDSQINTYVLAGAISLEAGDDPLYVSYCRSISGSWDKRKSTKTKIEKMTNLPQIHIALLIYIKISN